MRVKPVEGDILTLDPAGGDSTAGLFFFHSWSKWEAGENKGEKGDNWLKQTRNIENWTQKGDIKIIAVETGKLINKYRYTYQMPELIKVVGSVEALADRRGIQYIEVSNISTSKANDEALRGEIPGLKRIRVKNGNGKGGRPKEQWVFKDQELGEHAKDAVLVFYILWTKRLKREWPWVD
jgi:hypothetical protein